MQIKKILITAVLFSIGIATMSGQSIENQATDLLSQGEESSGEMVTIRKFIPDVSPQTKAMIRYDNSSDVGNTGSFNYSVPLIHWEDPDFDFPINLNYSGTGFKPSEPDNFTGKDWSLACGGVIYRKVVGMPDDFLWDEDGSDYTQGFLSTIKQGFDKESIKDSLLYGRPEYLLGMWYSENVLALNYDNFKYEAASDIYHFNFGRHSGKFMIDYDGSILVYGNDGGHYDVDISGYELVSNTSNYTSTQYPLYTISLVSDETVNVSSDANKVSVSLISNVEELDVDFGGGEEWIKLNNVADAFGKKIVQFDVVRSSEFKDRTAVLTLSGAATDDAVTVTVNQAQRDTAFVEGEQKIIKGLEAMYVDIVIKSNVDITYSVPSWLTRTINSNTDKDETGLKTQHVTLSADACGGSRSATISFRGGYSTVGSFFIKQQNPNPIFTEIPDDNLRLNLESQGWIIPDDGIKCELIEAGISGTSLVIGQTTPDAWSSDPIRSIEGLENFPNLESLTLGSIMVEKVDVSAYPKLKELKLINLCEVTEVNTGSLPITDVTNVAGSYTYTNVNQIVVKGDNIENVDFSASGYYIGYEYTFESIDVTGCPKLKTVNVSRASSWGEESSLNTLYMTAAQKESVAVTKQDKVEIVVK